MDATCSIQDSIHVFRLVHKYVSRILGTYQRGFYVFLGYMKILLSVLFNFNFLIITKTVFGFNNDSLVI